MSPGRLAAGVTALLMLAGCAASATAGVAPSYSSATASPAASAAPAAPVVLPTYGGTLRIASAGPIVWSDPAGNVTAAGAELSRLTSRQLVSYDGVDSLADEQEPNGDLAISPGDVSDDKLSVIFRLRKLEYAPPLTTTLRAADVVFGMALLCDPNRPSADAIRLAAVVVGYAAFCDGLQALPRGSEAAVKTYIDRHPISGLELMSTQVFRIKLTKPTGSLVNVLAEPDLTPFPEAAFSPPTGVISWVQAPELGPYVRVATATGLTFNRNSHWDATQDPLRRAYVDHVVVTARSTPTAAAAAVRSGEADLVLAAGEIGVSPGLAGDGVLRTSVAGDLVALLPSASASGACSSALANPDVRRAIAIAVDRRPVVASLRAATVTDWPIPEGIVGATTNPPSTGTVVGANSGVTFAAPTASATPSESAATEPGVSQLVGESMTPGGAGDPARASTLLGADLPRSEGRITCTVTASDADSGVPDPTLAGVLAVLPAAFAAAGVTIRTSGSGPAALSLVRLTSSWRGDSAAELLAPLLVHATDPVLLAAAARAEDENDQNLASQRWALVASVLVQDGALVPLAEDQVASLSSTRLHNFRWLNLARDADLANASVAS